MRLYINFMTVDHVVCATVASALEMHEVWYDPNGADYPMQWSELQQRLTWCDGLVYLMSPEAVHSAACQQALYIAQSMQKHVFPVIVKPHTTIPSSLQHIDQINLSNGVTAEAVQHLLNVIFQAERVSSPNLNRTLVSHAGNSVVLQDGSYLTPDNVELVIEEAAEALDLGEYAQAVTLLECVKASGLDLYFVDVNALLEEATVALEQEIYWQRAEREYAPIVALMKRERTRELGREAFRQFRKYFPDYDPQDLAAMCQFDSGLQIEWCRIPGGEVYVERLSQRITADSFRIAKYPITHAQFMQFIEADNGYANSVWWDFSPEARKWRSVHPAPLLNPEHTDDMPAVNICWYEAVAYCNWFSHETGIMITLPTETEWQLAAQGNSTRRYPWGDEYNETFCNTKECGIRQITSVKRYVRGASPYGVYDMAGNVWEWCANSEYDSIPEQPEITDKRVVKGGSFISSRRRAQCDFYFALNPECRYESIGFRVIVRD
ncbi:MAG: SUMF1/EgtB/PvdO family nonheme iron enzyme [Anaerolineae bacterium]|nr:SUMF1/EgtB/PvdO family nonheme iron enzyme [Anaerolineae bacterium]